MRLCITVEGDTDRNQIEPYTLINVAFDRTPAEIQQKVIKLVQQLAMEISNEDQVKQREEDETFKDRMNDAREAMASHSGLFQNRNDLGDG